MGNKYGAKRTWSNLTNRWFASKAECIRGEELHLLEQAGEISDLQYQLRFVLSDKPKITITIDFAYVEDSYFSEYKVPCKVRKYEDTKGVLTRDFRTKMAWLEEKHGVRVNLSGTTPIR